MIQFAEEIFEEKSNQNEILIWNAMINAYVRNGKLEKIYKNGIKQ
ncbi:MAG: hypothetical protein HRT40_12915 [Campylobacteraceae bacterium]|nr:hypothetical protein [Campylobacteraceae bacterium]